MTDLTRITAHTGYWLRREAATPPEPDDLIFVESLHGQHVAARTLSGTVQLTAEALVRDYLPAADGEALRSAQVRGIEEAFSRLTQESLGLPEHLQQGGGELALRAETARQHAERIAVQAGTYAQALKAAAEERLVALKVQLEPMQRYTQTLQNIGRTLQLYLGHDERATLLLDGERAPEDTPIAIHADIAYMDEWMEQQASDEGGLERFLDWVRQDGRAYELLPDERGILGMRRAVRSRNWQDDREQARVRQLHLLVRNGQQVYHVAVDPDFKLENRLIASRQVFVNDIRPETGEWQVGSDRYLFALHEAEPKRRAHMRAALILQGLLDRSALLTPLKAGLNLLDPRSYERDVVIIDLEYALEADRETAAEFQARVNSEIGRGSRVTGIFNEIRMSDERTAYGENVLTGRTRDLRRPDNGQVLLLNDMDYLKRYTATYQHPGAGSSSTIHLRPGDRFILNLDHDDVTPERLRRLLTRHDTRRSYQLMMPLLRSALHILDTEAAEQQQHQEEVDRFILSSGLDPETARPLVFRAWRRQPDLELDAVLRTVVTQLEREQRDQQSGVLAQLLSATQDVGTLGRVWVRSGVLNAYDPEPGGWYVRVTTARYRAGQADLTTQRWQALSQSSHLKGLPIGPDLALRQYPPRPNPAGAFTVPDLETLLPQILEQAAGQIKGDLRAVAVVADFRPNVMFRGIRVDVYHLPPEGSAVQVLIRLFRDTDVRMLAHDPQRTHGPEHEDRHDAQVTLLWDDDGLLALRERNQVLAEQAQAGHDRYRQIDQAVQQAARALEDSWYQERERTYLRQGNPPALWSTHRATLHPPDRRSELFALYRHASDLGDPLTGTPEEIAQRTDQTWQGTA